MSCFSSGAVLINQLIRKQMREQSSAENIALETIRKRVEAIRSRYARQTLDSIVEPGNYADGKLHDFRLCVFAPTLSGGECVSCRCTAWHLCRDGEWSLGNVLQLARFARVFRHLYGFHSQCATFVDTNR